MATVKSEVVIRGTIELPAYEESDKEMNRVVEQAKKYPIDTLDDVEVEDIELYKEHWK
ncbi:hypothetical protein FH120_02180 [Staphylococcus hominis]|uniref:hypothetical protein n=1 Tax=Staphylococcus hominis TaxID=1290 RepID=UPI001F572D44|nr:hypothetical protein [Staphylococcus hominis]MCI2870749.1 hypothetical protein [Staphylococcus hominis]MCI2874988.1 hypothetical protein [Staphylococcus hominis]